MHPVQGIHHITAMAGDPQRNLHFYHELLGQRMIKRTVNFDDPTTYHLYYGDQVGTPGTALTFFPWPNARRGKPGNGEVTATAYSVKAASMGYWWDRLRAHDVYALTRDVRFGQDLIGFHDPDGMRVELIADDAVPAPQLWESGPVPTEHALGAFHGVTIWLDAPDATATLLTEQFGYRFAAEAGDRLRYVAASDLHALYVDLVVRPGQPHGRMGAGSVHHVAFRTADDAEQLAYRDRLLRAGHAVTTVQDRQYFHSIYFREPGGTLFEMATDGPGFTIDETIPDLGHGLMLPPWYERSRAQIEAALPSLTLPESPTVTAL